MENVIIKLQKIEANAVWTKPHIKMCKIRLKHILF